MDADAFPIASMAAAARADADRDDAHIRDLIEQVLFTVAGRAREPARTSAAA